MAKRRDDPFGIPACFYWTVDEVADWVESIGFGKYKENFRSHFINGRKFLTIEHSMLPKLGIHPFDDIMNLMKLIRDQLHILRARKDKWSPWPPHTRSEYIAEPNPTGTMRMSWSYLKHLQFVEPLLEYRLEGFKYKNLHYSGWTMEPGWDAELKATLEKQGRNMPDTMQERLREAALLSVNRDTPKENRRAKTKIVAVVKGQNKDGTLNVSLLPEGFVKPKLSDVLEEVNFRNVTIPKRRHGVNGPSARSQGCCQNTVFIWKKMEDTRGYPQLMIADDRDC